MVDYSLPLFWCVVVLSRILFLVMGRYPRKFAGNLQVERKEAHDPTKNTDRYLGSPSYLSSLSF